MMNRSQSGFTLPTVLVIGLTLLIIALSMMQSVGSIRSSLDDQYYQRLATEAAEAGAAYANFCLGRSSFTQTWGPAVSKPSLTQSTNCDGSNRTPAVTSLTTVGNVRSTFSIGNLETRNDGAIIISVTGTSSLVRTGTNDAFRTYTKVLKQLVNWKIYKASVSASGFFRTCSIVTSELYCWGTNDYGQLGNGTNTDSLKPVQVKQNSGILANKVVDSLFAAQYHNCAVAAAKAYCWGRNNSGQLGNNSSTDSNIPVTVRAVSGSSDLANVTTVGGAGDTSCAIAAGKIYCWGRNTYGTVGNNSGSSSFTRPVAVSTTNLGSSYTATKLSTSGSGSGNMCAIADSKAYCWGNNEAGQIGNNTSGSTRIRVPTLVAGSLSGKTVTAISQDGYADNSGGSYVHVCAVADGKAYCWGDNSFGQLGNNSTTNSPTPVEVGGLLTGKTVQDVAVGLHHTCALANSKVYCWGRRTYGQVGDGVSGGSATNALVPVAVKADVDGTDALYGKTITAIGGGGNRGCAVADLKSYCWGANGSGQLGDDTQIDRNTPTESIFLRPAAPAFIF